MRVGLIAVALIYLLGPSAANAGLIGARFEAVVTSTSGEQGLISVGESFHGSFSWDTDASLGVSNPPGLPVPPFGTAPVFILDAATLGPKLSLGPPGAFRGPNTEYTAALSAAAFPQSDVANSIGFTAFADGAGWPATDGVVFSLSLSDPTRTVVGGLQLPESLALGDFENTRVLLAGFGNEWSVEAEITSLSTRPIPEPSSVFSFASGILIVWTACRRRRSA